MSDNVPRWDWNYDGMDIHPEGDFIRITDYEHIVNQNAILREALEKIIKNCGSGSEGAFIAREALDRAGANSANGGRE